MDWRRKRRNTKKGSTVTVIDEVNGLKAYQTSKGTRYLFGLLDLQQVNYTLPYNHNYYKTLFQPHYGPVFIIPDFDSKKFREDTEKVKKEIEKSAAEFNQHMEEASKALSKATEHFKELDKSIKRIEEANKLMIEAADVSDALEALDNIEDIIRTMNSDLDRINNNINGINGNLSNANSSITEVNKNINNVKETLQKTVSKVTGSDVNINIKQIAVQQQLSNLYSANLTIDSSLLPFEMAGSTYSNLIEDFMGTTLTTAPVSGDLVALTEVLSGKTINGDTLTDADYGLYAMTVMFGSVGRTGKTVFKAVDGMAPVVKKPKFSSEKIDLSWLEKLGDRYTAYEITGTVVAKNEVRDISRRVYRLNDIDWDFVPTIKGKKNTKTNLELALSGKSPYAKDNTQIVLHHSTQREPGTMIEVRGSKHVELNSILHGTINNGDSFRNDDILDRQYDNFRYNYWISRAKEVQLGIK